MKRVSSSAERRWIRPNQRQRRKAIPRHRTTWNLLLADGVPLIPPPLPTRWRAPTAVCYITNAARSWDRAPPNTGHAREAQRRSTKRTPSRLPRPRMPNVENSAKGGQPPCLLILQMVLAVQWLQLFRRLRKDTSKGARHPHRLVLYPQWRVPHVSRFSKRGIPQPHRSVGFANDQGPMTENCVCRSRRPRFPDTQHLKPDTCLQSFGSTIPFCAWYFPFRSA